MEIRFVGKSEKDLSAWKQSGNRKIMKRIEDILTSITSTPFSGIGKPEPLKYELSGKWSRRITDEDRIVYSVENNEIMVYSLKGHYI